MVSTVTATALLVVEFPELSVGNRGSTCGQRSPPLGGIPRQVL